MSDIAVHLESLGKQYRIGKKESSYKTLRETLTDAVTAPLRKIGKLWRNEEREVAERYEMFWALRDVSLDIKHGEVVGIIGPNGAGKSTLLKILSRITEPTTGFAELHGRVSSLLEVGTGMHPELTGRENIHLNGAILGMKRTEIAHKFDDIVAFSEVEKFIDTPVKHYSSGMYLRLAFAVAAHLEPEILIVDEVLAVGDASFQQKCLNKMQDVSQHGRTVLFVSHTMLAITRLCERAILLNEGRVVQDGPAHQVVSAYLSSGLAMTAAREWHDLAKAPGDDIVRMCAVRVRTEDGQITDLVDVQQSVSIEVEYEVLQSGYVLVPALGFDTEERICAFVTSDHSSEWRRQPRPIGRFISTVRIPGNFLAEGKLTVGAGILTENPFTIHCDEPYAVAFQVVDTMSGSSARGDYTGRIPGVVRPLFQWDAQLLPHDHRKVAAV